MLGGNSRSAAQEKEVVEKERKVSQIDPPAIVREQIINVFSRFKLDKRLRDLAQKQANKMAAAGSCFHTEDLLSHFGQYSALAEIVAAGQPTFEHAIIDWMNSPGHRANILNPAYTHAGGGVARGSDGRLYWCVIFGGK